MRRSRSGRESEEGGVIKDVVATLSAARLPPIETVVGVIASIIHSIPDARIILCASELALGVSQASEDLLDYDRLLDRRKEEI